MRRAELYRRAREHSGPWDMIVAGGGATGAGIAVDAAARGYDVLLLERGDFGKGTSSRSTKLVHGGVRYLEQGNIALVMEALKERGLLLRNAPHLVRNLAFVVPTYQWWEGPFYGAGLKLYNLLAGKYGFGASRILSRTETLERLPALDPEGLRGGVVYFDGQFDDARLLIDLIATAYEQGATPLNYVEVASFTRGADALIDGVVARDIATGEEFQARARVVINATGAFTDELRRAADPSAQPMLSLSQGVHLVFASEFLESDSAIMVPRTSDGRVMFAIPWHGHVLAGTTDTPISAPSPEPAAFEQEVELILKTIGRYLAKKPRESDILSIFAGIRPLVRSGNGENTAALSRDHTIRIDASGLVTICGGKWTTYRRMAEDCVNQAATLAGLPERACTTYELRIHCGDSEVEELKKEDAALAAPLHPALPYTGADIVIAARREMAVTLEDALARRTRALFLNARAAVETAPRAAALMACELGRDETWQREQIAAFTEVARNYLRPLAFK